MHSVLFVLSHQALRELQTVSLLGCINCRRGDLHMATACHTKLVSRAKIGSEIPFSI